MKVTECCNEVEVEDEVRSYIVRDIFRQSTDFLRRIIAPNDVVGGVLSLLPAWRTTFDGSLLGMENGL